MKTSTISISGHYEIKQKRSRTYGNYITLKPVLRKSERLKLSALSLNAFSTPLSFTFTITISEDENTQQLLTYTNKDLISRKDFFSEQIKNQLEKMVSSGSASRSRPIGLEMRDVKMVLKQTKSRLKNGCCGPVITKKSYSPTRKIQK